MHYARKILCMDFFVPMSPIFQYDYFGVNFCMHAQKIIWLRFYIYFDQIWNAGFSHHFGRKYAKSQTKWAKTLTLRTVPVIKYTLPTFYTLLARLDSDFSYCKPMLRRQQVPEFSARSLNSALAWSGQGAGGGSHIPRRVLERCPW